MFKKTSVSLWRWSLENETILTLFDYVPVFTGQWNVNVEIQLCRRVLSLPSIFESALNCCYVTARSNKIIAFV